MFLETMFWKVRLERTSKSSGMSAKKSPTDDLVIRREFSDQTLSDFHSSQYLKVCKDLKVCKYYEPGPKMRSSKLLLNNPLYYLFVFNNLDLYIALFILPLSLS